MTAMKGALQERETQWFPASVLRHHYRQSRSPSRNGVSVARWDSLGNGVNQAGDSLNQSIGDDAAQRAGGGPAMAEAPAGAPLRLRLQSEQLKIDPLVSCT